MEVAAAHEYGGCLRLVEQDRSVIRERGKDGMGVAVDDSFGRRKGWD